MKVKPYPLLKLNPTHLHWWKSILNYSIAESKPLLWLSLKLSYNPKNRLIWPRLGVSWPELQFKFTDGYEMIHKACCCIEDVPYYFSGSSIKFQGHMGEKSTI